MQRIETTAGWLAARGIGPGDVVALLMKKQPGLPRADLATSQLGALSLPINHRLAADEVGYIVHNAGARLLLCDQELASGAVGLPHVVTVDAAAQRNSRRLASLAQAPARMHAACPEDLFRLMYTSGTTDRPKGVMHTYSNFYWKCADHVVLDAGRHPRPRRARRPQPGERALGGGRRRAHSRSAHPSLLRPLPAGTLCGRQRPHRDVRRRHHDGGRARD
jgi:long-subunit acyl-CoA synthetase (AMP-forming)